MKVYIAGPMSGLPAYNVAAFEAAAERIRAEGMVAVSPFECNSVVWRKHYGRDFDPYTDKCDWGDPILREMLVEDIAALGSADAIAFLPGWRRSKGATLEHRIAELFGLAMYDAETLEPLQDETILQEAQRLVHGDRGAAYGHPFDDYTRTSRMWEAMLGLPEGFIGPRKAAHMMIAVKLSREMNKSKRDNRTDIAGYAECADMIAQREGK